MAAASYGAKTNQKMTIFRDKEKNEKSNVFS